MDLRKKIIIIVGFFLILSVGAVIIVIKTFDRIEDQLLAKCEMEARIGARVIRNIMQMMIHTGRLTREQLMDPAYVEIPGSNPKKYHTKYDMVFDATMQKFEDEYLNDHDVIFAIAIDRNGYVPTHNSKYSRPPEKDPVKNMIYSRSKRNFADKQEIKEILRHRGEGTVRYLYQRDTGELVWNIGAPITIGGQHWGAFLIGISLHRISIIKNQMFIITLTIMIVVLSFTLLIILAVIPQKFLAQKPESRSGPPRG